MFMVFLVIFKNVKKLVQWIGLALLFLSFLYTRCKSPWDKQLLINKKKLRVSQRCFFKFLLAACDRGFGTGPMKFRKAAVWTSGCEIQSLPLSPSSPFSFPSIIFARPSSIECKQTTPSRIFNSLENTPIRVA